MINVPGISLKLLLNIFLVLDNQLYHGKYLAKIKIMYHQNLNEVRFLVLINLYFLLVFINRINQQSLFKKLIFMVLYRFLEKKKVQK